MTPDCLFIRQVYLESVLCGGASSAGPGELAVSALILFLPCKDGAEGERGGWSGALRKKIMHVFHTSQ